MITHDHYTEIQDKYGEFASWAVWVNEDIKPKSNIGDMSVFDLDRNPNLLETLNPNVIMVGLNFSRTIEKMAFITEYGHIVNLKNTKLSDEKLYGIPIF